MRAGRAASHSRVGSHVVALIGRRGRFVVAEPFFHRAKPLIVERGSDARDGDLVLLAPSSRGRGHARLVRRIGRPDVARDVIEALMLDRGLARGFERAVEAQAEDVAQDAPAEIAGRRDLRALTTFTIDPASARDFDDAISVETLGDGHWRVWVHIADVSALVRPGTRLDREARRRGTSVYVPNAVEPMLPESISNGACSLVPGQDRLAVTVELEMDGHRVVKSSFCRSVIRSDARLDYDQVDRVFAGEESAQAPWAEPLAAARLLAAALEAERQRRGALVVESTEPEFAFDDAGHVTEVRPAVQTESHRVIEHLMIAANEAVARLLEERRLPTLYRVHERPDPPRIERLVAQLEALDVPTPPLPAHMTAQQAADLAGEASRLVQEHVRRSGHGTIGISSIVLRALKQAHYTPANAGHSGLHSTAYCHFTSPIRRYPDVVCHRALLSAIGAGEEPHRADELVELGAWCSEREREAMSIERAADDIAHCFLLERELFEGGWDQVFEGEVTGVIGAGAFVTFGARGYEGMLPVRFLRGDWWDVDELETRLVAAESGRSLAIGDPVRVQVDRVDKPRGRVDLLPVEL